MTDIQLPEIDDRITELEERLGQLRRRKRAIVGGRASGDARQRHDRNEQIRAYFRERPHSYGALTETAHKFGLSTKQVGRILRAKIATESSDCSDPSVDLSVEESNGQPGRLASPEPRVDGLSPAEVASTATESIGPGFAPDPRIKAVLDLIENGGILADNMRWDANMALIRGGPSVRREPLVRLLYEFADKWEDLLSNLDHAVKPK